MFFVTKSKFYQRVQSFFKPVAGALVLILLLKATGFIGSVSFFTQSAVMKTGLLNAAITPPDKETNFNYDFTIKDLAGNKYTFDQFKGKVVFLNLWATWCGPCRAEMPNIQKLFASIEKDKVAFVMLSIDEDKNKLKVQNYIQKGAYTFPVFMPSGYLSDQLQVPSIPTTFVISKEGKIIMKEIGTTNYNTTKFKKFLEEEANK